MSWLLMVTPPKIVVDSLVVGCYNYFSRQRCCLQVIWILFDNRLSVKRKIVADNGVSALTLYECDFKKLEEYLCDDTEDDHQPFPLGEFLCNLLSINFENVAKSISLFLEENWIKGNEFPTEQLQGLVNRLCVTSEFGEMRDMFTLLKYLYSKGETQEVINVYGNLKDAFFFETFECFKVGAVLQAYLEESENIPEMISATNFERFINGFLEVKIMRNDQAASLSEYSFGQDIFPGSDIRGIVKDVFLNLEQFNDSYSVFALDSLDTLLISSIYYFFLNGFCFKRCKNCGKFFVPLSRSDEMYCNNVSPQDQMRTCKEYGSQKLWYDRLKSDEVAKLARNIYSAKQMLVRRNPDIVGYKKMFDYFKIERKKWEVLVKSGVKSKEEYINWLNEMKAKKTL